MKNIILNIAVIFLLLNTTIFADGKLVMRGYSKNPKMAEFIKNNRYNDSLVSHEQVIRGYSVNTEMTAHLEKSPGYSYPATPREFLSNDYVTINGVIFKKKPIDTALAVLDAVDTAATVYEVALVAVAITGFIAGTPVITTIAVGTAIVVTVRLIWKNKKWVVEVIRKSWNKLASIITELKKAQGNGKILSTAKSGAKKIGNKVGDLAKPRRVPKAKNWKKYANTCPDRVKGKVCYNDKGYPKFDSATDINLGYTNKERRELLLKASKEPDLEAARALLHKEHMERFGVGVRNQLNKNHPDYNKALVKELGGSKKANEVRGMLDKNPGSPIPGFRRHHIESDPNIIQLVPENFHSVKHVGGMKIQWMNDLPHSTI